MAQVYKCIQRDTDKITLELTQQEFDRIVLALLADSDWTCDIEEHNVTCRQLIDQLLPHSPANN